MTPAARAPQVELLYPGVGVGGREPGSTERRGQPPDPVRYVLWFAASDLYPHRNGSELVPRRALHVRQVPRDPKQAARALRDHQQRTRQRVDQLLAGTVRITARRPTP